MSTNPKAWLAVRDLGGGVEVREIVTESQEQAARDAGYTLVPLVPVSGEPVAFAEEDLHDCVPAGDPIAGGVMFCVPLYAHPPHALAAAQAGVKRLREALEAVKRYLAVGNATSAYNLTFVALSTPADTSELDRLVADARRYRWLRKEHAINDPLAAIVWKRDGLRNGSEWVNTVDARELDDLIDASLAGNGVQL